MILTLFCLLKILDSDLDLQVRKTSPGIVFTYFKNTSTSKGSLIYLVVGLTSFFSYHAHDFDIFIIICLLCVLYSIVVAMLILLVNYSTHQQ